MWLKLAWAGVLVTAALQAAEPVSFSKDIAPLFLAKCVGCHGPEKSKGKYRLDTFEQLQRPGASEDAPVVARAPAESLLLELLMETDEDSRMPQEDEQLSAASVGLVHDWIEQGALFDGPDPKSSLASLVLPINHPAPPETYPFPVPVSALAFSPNGQELMVGGYGEVTVWNPGNGVLIRRLTNLVERTQSLAFHPREPWLAVGGGLPGRLGEIRILNPEDGSLVHLLDRLPDLVMSVRFSPDGSKLAAAVADNAIHIYSMTNFQETMVIEQHADWVMDIAFSPTGKQLASASRDKTSRVFDLETGRLEISYLEHDQPVFAVAWDEAGDHVWSGGRGKELHIWKVKDGKKKSVLSGYGDDLCRVLQVGDQVFAASADGKIRQYIGAEKPKQIHVLGGHEEAVYSLAYDEKSGRLASGGHDGEVRVWDVKDRNLLVSFMAVP